QGDAGIGALGLRIACPGCAAPGTHGSKRLVIAWRSDPAAHAEHVARDGDIGDAPNQIGHRHRAVRHLVTTVDAVGAVVAQHIHVSERHSDFSFVGETRLRFAGVDIGLLDHHAVDDGTTAFDGDAVTLHRNDAFDVVDLLLLGMHVDCDLATAGVAAAIVGG